MAVVSDSKVNYLNYFLSNLNGTYFAFECLIQAESRFDGLHKAVTGPKLLSHKPG